MKKRALVVVLWMFWIQGFSQTDSTSNYELFDLSLEELLKLDIVDKNFYLYGYINSNFQKTFSVPVLDDDGRATTISEPGEWIPVKNFHLYGRGNLSSRIGYLFNIALNNTEALESPERLG